MTLDARVAIIRYRVPNFRACGMSGTPAQTRGTPERRPSHLTDVSIEVSGAKRCFVELTFPRDHIRRTFREQVDLARLVEA